MSEKVELGTRIIGKEIGVMVPSTVIAVMTYQAYINLLSSEPLCRNSLDKFDSLYPDWIEKDVIVSKFDEPTCPMSLFDYSKLIDSIEDVDFITVMREKHKDIYTEFIQYQYNMLPKTMTIVYPVDDVEIL